MTMKDGFAIAPERLTYWLLSTITLNLLLLFWLIGASHMESEVTLWARYTARISFWFFLLSYCASPLYRQWPNNKISRIIRRNRRNAGLGFALAHFIHLPAILLFYQVNEEKMGWVTLIFGGLAFVLILLMAVTSSDRAIKAITYRNWKSLHRFGAHYVAFIFAIAYTLGIMKDVYTILPAAAIWFVLILRIKEALKNRKS